MLVIMLQVEKFFKSAADNRTLTEDLQKEKSIIFIYIIGIDDNGHLYGPSTKQTMKTVALVDKGLFIISRVYNPISLASSKICSIDLDLYFALIKKKVQLKLYNL